MKFQSLQANNYKTKKNHLDNKIMELARENSVFWDFLGLENYMQFFLSSKIHVRSIVGILGLILSSLAFSQAVTTPTETIPRLDQEPTLADFSGMQTGTAVARSMTRVDVFVQREPVDSVAPLQRTEIYVGYDDIKFYAIFLAFDDQPDQIRATLSSRENIDGDDSVELTLDTFND